MPYCVTIALAISVHFSMSLAAPVVSSPNTSSSAERPPSRRHLRAELRLAVRVAVLGQEPA